MTLRALALLALAASAVAAQPARPTPTAPPLWIGIFDPQLPPHPPWTNTQRTDVPHAGVVRVFAPETGDAATGEVVVVHPLLARSARGTVERGVVALRDFAYDQRDNDDGVLVLPAATPIAFVAPSTADTAAIKAILLRTDALARVKRALANLELAGLDTNADGKPDIVTTYGCAAWFDGNCQARGQFVLIRRANRWQLAP